MALACAALALLAVLATVAPEQAAAQTTTFISTTGQTSAAGDTPDIRAVAFTTGAGTYTLSSAGLFLRDAATITPQVVIYSGGTATTPGTTVVATMANPGTFADNAVHTFTAPPNTTLSASTTYWLVTSNSAATDGTGFRVGTTSSNSLDSGTAAGWSHGGDYVAGGGGSWTLATSRYLRFQIRGTTTTSTNNPPTVANTIPDQTATVGTAFSYVFPANTFSDADTSDTLTYTATKAAGTDLPLWLAFAASTRTFSGTPTDAGMVALKVTASDGNGGSVSDTFDITVAADPNAHCNASDTSELWCGTLTVGVGAGVAYGYNANLSLGSVAPRTFTHGGATITVNVLLYNGNRLGFYMSSALGAGDFSLEIGTGGAKRSFAMNNPGTQTDFLNHGLSWSANETVPVKLLLVNTPATGAPTITGTAQVGQTLTATVGDIADVDGLPDPFLTDANTSFQWIRTAAGVDTNISGATASTYTLVAADLGTTIKVRVSFTGNNGFAETRTSAVTAAVSANNPPTSSNKNLALNEDTELTFFASDFPFTDADGNSLSSVKILSLPATDKGTLTFSGMALTSGDLPQTVPAAQFNSLKYVPPANGNGGNIPFTSFTFRVNDGTDDSAATYTLTFLVFRVNDAATGQPGITGTAQVGQTLAATAGTIADVDGLPDPFLTDTNTSFQWVRVTSGTDADISGARDSTYTLVADDEGKKIKVKVSFLDTEASTNLTEGPLTSAATATVSASTNTPATGAPTITGTAQVGQMLTAGTTAIMDADGLTTPSYTYQWIRVATDNTETNIASATASTYTLVAADLGTTIKVKVSFTDDASNPETLTSTATAAVSAAANNPPTVATAIPDQTAMAGTAFSYAFPDTTFTDADTGDTLSYTATKADDTALPTWLDFAAGTRTFSGTPTAAETVAVKVTASDGNGGSVSDTFDITVAADTTPPTLTSATVIGAGGHIEFQFSENIPLLNQPPGSAFTVTADGIAVTTPNSPTWASQLTPDLLRLRVSPVIFQGQAVVVTYTDPTAGDDANAIQDAAGNDTATFTTGMNGVPAVTNNSITTNTLATGAPTITGTAQVGQTLTAGTTAIMDADGLTSVSYTYQWIRTAAGVDTNISGATASTYTLVAADLGTTIKVKVSFTDDASNAETLTSNVSVIIARPANTAATGKPGITGTAQVGQTLTATVGTSADVDGLPDPFLTDTNTSFQWIRVATDNTETNIASATASTYTLVDADLGTTIKVKVGFVDNYDYDETLTSDATAAVAASTTSVPGAPTGLAATASGTTAINLSWTAPGSTGGSAITGYKIEVSPNGTSGWTDQVADTNSTATTYAHTGLAAGDTRHYRVSAINTNGAGTASNVDSATTGTSVPGAPTGLTATASGTTAINLSWTAPASTGGSAITGYKIEVSPNGTSGWTDQVADTNSTATTYAHTGLAAGDTRHYRVSAINTNGAGTASNVDSATTGTSVPGAPTGLTATASGTTAINLSWTAPGSTGGSAITGYKIEVSPNGTSGWTDQVADTNSTATTYAHTGLAVGDTRHYRVSAINTNGAGTASNVANATTGQTTVPPTLTSATVFEGGVYIYLKFSENMLQSNLPPASAFTVTAAGSAVTVYYVLLAVAPAPLNAFWILVRPTIDQGQVVVVTYTDPTAGNDAYAIQNTAGNDAATFTTGMNGVPAVTNNSTVNTPATGAPTITGMAQVGQTLTAATTGIMDADGLTSVSYAYQWIRVDGGTETNISGATASAYMLVAADLGTTVKVTVSFTDDASYAETLTSAATAAVSAAPNTPATGAPTITGTAQVGQTLTATVGTIADANGLPDPFLADANTSFQWVQVNLGTETNIASATASTYTLVREDWAASVRVKVAFQDAQGNSEGPLTSSSVIIVKPANTAATGKPGITGTAQVGQTLTATVGTSADVDGLPNPFLTDVNTSFQWIRVATDNTETNIASATASTYTLVTDDAGTTIKVKVGFVDNYDYDEMLTSDATAAVSAAANTPATGAPTITGMAQVGQTLTADTTAIMDADGLTSVSYTYQWIRVDDNTETNISGATASTYTLVTADLGTTIKVRVSFTDDASNPETRTSAATAVVAAAPNTPATGAPTITGTAQVGQTLTATVGTIADANGLPDPFLTDANTSFQWVQVNLGTETNIASATASTYTLVREDWAASVRVKVAFQDAQGNSEGPLTSSSVIIVKPANTAATGKPGITGTAQVGQTLTATVGTSADVDGLPNPFLTDVNTSFQWIRVATDNTETNIASATASTYTLVTDDAGTTIKVKVGFADNYDYDEMLTSDATAAVSAAANTPATGAPTITGTAQVGETLTADTTAIMDDDGLTTPSYTYQWIRVATDNSDTNIASATASTYTLVAADLGTTVKVRVSFTDDASNDETLTSNVSVIIARPANTAATGKPGITGTAQVGQTLTATVGTSADVDGLPDPFLTDANTSFQWIRVATDNTETNIASATASTYTLVTDDAGTTIKVKVGFVDNYDYDEMLTSDATAAVSAAANTPATGAPTITGMAQVGQTLTADTTAIMDADGLTSVSYTYQWIRVATDNSDTNIASATASTYMLVAADLGTTIKVRVSFTDDASNPETRTSAATAAVAAAANNLATGAPTITGMAQVGQTLTAGTTAIMDADGLTSVSYTYQWIRVATDNTETNIASATASTYMLVTADLGTTVKVRVSFTDDASNPETLTSAATVAATGAPPPPPPNIPPEVATRLVDQEATTGASFTYVIPADAFTDADGDRLTYAAVLSDGGMLPSWLTFDPATRTFTGTPGPGDSGTVRVTVTASDGTETVSDEFALMVTVPNTPPVVAIPLADQEVTVDVPFTYVVPANAFTDAEGDRLTYTAALSGGGMLPSWLVFDPATRTFTGTPASSDSGPVFVTVTASDGTATVSDEFALRVLMVAPSTLRAWTSRFGRTVATHVTDAVGERLRPSPEQDSQVTVGGYRLPLGRHAAGGADPDATEPETTTDRLASLLTGLVGRALGLAAPQGGDGTDPRVDEPDPRLGQSQPLQLPTVRLRDVLLGSSFRLTLGDDDASPGHMRLTAWGRVAGTQFDGRDGALTLDGNVLTGTVGVDSAWDRWLAGVAVSHSLGGGSFTGDGDGDLDSSTLTSIHPYLRYAVNERVDVWSVLGYGWGDMTLEPGTGGTLETDTTLLMGAFGGRGILLSAPDNAGFQLATRTDAMLTRTTSGAVAGLAATEAEAHRLRLVLEGTRPVLWPEGQSVTPTVELGVRHDWGDAETGFGLELGGRVQYADPNLGLTIEAAVRGLLTHEDSDYKEWGASGTIRIAPDPNGQGLSLTLAPTWGAASSGIESLWSRQTTAGLAPQGTRSAPTGRLNAEVSYGVAAPFGTGLLTPYVGTVLTDGADRTYRLGTRLELTGGWTTGVTLNLEGQRQEAAGPYPPNQGLRLQMTWGF